MSSLRNTRVSRKLWAVVGVSLLALVAYAVVSMLTVAEVRVGGPTYTGIALNNVLLADVLSPGTSGVRRVRPTPSPSRSTARSRPRPRRAQGP